MDFVVMDTISDVTVTSSPVKILDIRMSKTRFSRLFLAVLLLTSSNYYMNKLFYLYRDVPM